MAFTTYGSTQVLNGLIGRSSTGPLSNCYIALSTTAPQCGRNELHGTFVSGGICESDYRASGTSNAGHVSTRRRLPHPTPASSSFRKRLHMGTVTHFGLFTAQTGGNLVLYGTLTNPIAVAANYVPLFRVGNFSLTLS